MRGLNAILSLRLIDKLVKNCSNLLTVTELSVSSEFVFKVLDVLNSSLRDC